MWPPWHSHGCPLFPACCLCQASMPGQGALRAATCLKEVSEEQHPLGLAGQVAQGLLPAVGYPLRALPVSGSQVVVCLSGGKRARAEDSSPQSGTAGKAPVCPNPANTSWNHMLCGFVEAHGSGAQSPLLPLPPQV